MYKRPLVLALCLATYASTQSQNQPRGHWTGSLELPNRTMSIVIDLDKTEKGWVGSMAVPEQNASGLPLSDIRTEEGQWKFHIAGVPGSPGFAGKLSEDGKTLTGEFSQGGQALPLKLTHGGEPTVELPKASPAVAKEFTGEWEGALEGPGLRLLLKISNEAGIAKAMLVSLDQGGVEIPASAVEQKEAKLMLEVKAVNGGYRAEINKEGTELTGEWSQNGNSMPLKLKKAAAKAAPK